jgi:hypothetical protein
MPEGPSAQDRLLSPIEGWPGVFPYILRHSPLNFSLLPRPKWTKERGISFRPRSNAANPRQLAALPRGSVDFCRVIRAFDRVRRVFASVFASFAQGSTFIGDARPHFFRGNAATWRGFAVFSSASSCDGSVPEKGWTRRVDSVPPRSSTG